MWGILSKLAPIYSERTLCSLSRMCCFSYASPVSSASIHASDTLVLCRCPQRQDSVDRPKDRVAAEHAASLSVVTYFYQPNTPIKIKTPSAV